MAKALVRYAAIDFAICNDLTVIDFMFIDNICNVILIIPQSISFLQLIGHICIK